MYSAKSIPGEPLKINVVKKKLSFKVPTKKHNLESAVSLTPSLSPEQPRVSVVPITSAAEKRSNVRKQIVPKHKKKDRRSAATFYKGLENFVLDSSQTEKLQVWKGQKNETRSVSVEISEELSIASSI